MESKDSQATRFRNLLIERCHLPTDLQIDPMQITVEELVQRAFVRAEDPVMSDIEFLAICAEILEELSETCQENSMCLIWHRMWLEEFSRAKTFISEHMDLPAGLTAEQLARKVADYAYVTLVSDEEMPKFCSDVLGKWMAGDKD